MAKPEDEHADYGIPSQDFDTILSDDTSAAEHRSLLALKYPALSAAGSTDTLATLRPSQPLMLDKNFPPTQSPMAKDPASFEYSLTSKDDFAILDYSDRKECLTASDDDQSVGTVSSSTPTDMSNAETIDVDSDCDEEASKALANSLHFRPIQPTTASSDLKICGEDSTDPLREPLGGDRPSPQLEVDVEKEDDDSYIRDSDATITPKTNRSDTEKSASQTREAGASTVFGAMYASGRKHSLISLLSMVLLLSSIAGIVMQQLGHKHMDAASEMVVRGEALDKTLATFHEGALLNLAVKPEHVLHYPTKTSVNGTIKTTSVSFPSAVSIHVAKPNHLFVSLPKSPLQEKYPDNARIAVFKNGKAVENVNRTRLIRGVLHLALDQAEANGLVHINVLARGLNETVKVDLGNRLLQRATYQKAATHVQQSVRRDVSSAQNAAEALPSKALGVARSALVSSARTVALIRGRALATSKMLTLGVAQGYNKTASTSQKLTGIVKSSVSDTHRHAALVMTRKLRAARGAAKKLTGGIKSTAGLRSGTKPAKCSLASALKTARQNAVAIQKRFVVRRKMAVAPTLAEQARYKWESLSSMIKSHARGRPVDTSNNDPKTKAVAKRPKLGPIARQEARPRRVNTSSATRKRRDKAGNSL